MKQLATRMRFARALTSRPFALLWAGQTISALGDGAFFVAVAWQVLVLTGSATAMGVVLVAESVPRVLFLLVGGVVADRLPRRLVLLWSDTCRALAVGSIAALGWLHVLQLWHLVALALVFGVADAFFAPAYQAIPPQLVPLEDLPSANALTGLSRQLSTLVGPSLGAIFVALTGPAAAFAFDSATFVVSAFCLLAMRLPPSANAPTSTQLDESAASASPASAWGLRGVLADIREGFAYILSSSWLWVTIAIASVGNVAWAALQVSLPKLIHDVYGSGAWLLGAIFSAEAVGSIIATVVVGQLHKVRHRGPVAYAGIALASAALLSLGLPRTQASAPALAMAAGAVIGLGLGLFGIIWVTTLQELVPMEKLGRVSSVDWLGSLALMPIGLAVDGVLTDRMGPAWVFVVAGALNLGLCAIALTARGIRRLD
jgi:MFS family permease